MKVRKLYGLIKKTFYEKRKNSILYFFFLLVPFLLVVFHIFLRNISDKYSIETNNLSKTDKINFNDSIRHYILFLSNHLCSKQIDDEVYVNHICITPQNNQTSSFLSFAKDNGLNIFKIYKNEEDCLKHVKFAIELKKDDVNRIKHNNYNKIKEHSLEEIDILNNLKNNMKYKESISLDDLYKNIYSKKNYNTLLNLRIDEDTLKEIKKTKLYKSYIKEVMNFKNENYYQDFFNDEKKKLFFINFVKNNLIETNFSCGLLYIQNEDELKKKNLKLSHLFERKMGGRKNIYKSEDDINYKVYYNMGDTPNIGKMENNYITKVDNYNSKKANLNSNKIKYDAEHNLINNTTYKIRVGDYALLNYNENYFFNDININLKQNFLSFNTIDDLSFNIYINEWYYCSFFAVLEYYYNSFLLKYYSNNLEEYKRGMNKENIINKISILKNPKKKFFLNDFFLYKMPMNPIKINAFKSFEKNIFRVIIFLCICIFIANICFDINKERKMNIANFLCCIKINKYYYYYSWLLFYFIMLFIYNIFFTFVIYFFVYCQLINYFILFLYIYFFLMNSLLFTVTCMQFSSSSSINYIITFLLFFLFSSFRLIIHSGVNEVLLFFILLIPHSSFCLALDFFFILVANNMKIGYAQLFIRIESISLMNLLLYSIGSFLLLNLLLSFIIFCKKRRLNIFNKKKRKNSTVNQSDTLLFESSEEEEENIIKPLKSFKGNMDIKIEKNRIKSKYYNQYTNNKELNNDSFYLIIQNVNKYYGDKHVLKDVTLTLKSNRIFVLLGENGSGKSTLINIITTMITKDSGKITFINNTLKKKKKELIDINDYRNNISNVSLYGKYIKGIFLNKIVKKNAKKIDEFKISYCTQNVILYDNLTFYETIKIFLLYYNKNVEKYLKKKRTLRILKDLDLGKYLNERIQNLTDETKKKISIFICFIVKQDIYILDEPFIALDIQTKMKLFKFFDKIKKNNIIFICTHDIYEANNFANDIAIIKNGEIIFNGSKSSFQKLIDYKFILNIQFIQSNNEEIDYLSQDKVMLSLCKSSKNKKDALHNISSPYTDSSNRYNKDYIIESFNNNDSNHNEINTIVHNTNEKDNKNKVLKKEIIDFIKSNREENKNCFIFNGIHIYCTYKISEIDSLKRTLYFLSKFKNILFYQLKTIDIYYTYIYIYTYSKKKKLLKNIHDKDIRCLLYIDPMFYLFFYNFKYFYEQNNLLFSKNKNEEMNVHDFNYLSEILVNNNSRNKQEEKRFLRKEKGETIKENADIKEEKTNEDAKKIDVNRYLKKKMEKRNSLFKKLTNFFSTYIKPMLLLKIKKDLSSKIFYCYKFLVPLFILFFGLLIIKCISSYGKIKNIKLDHNTISSINLKDVTLNYYIKYETEMSGNDVNMKSFDKNENANYRKLSLKEQITQKKKLNFHNVNNIINLKNGYNFNRLTTNSFNFYNNTINTLLQKYCLNEKINYIDDPIDEENLYDSVNNYLKRRSEIDNNISLGSFVFYIKEKQNKENIDNNTYVEMNIYLFYNYTSIHSYAYHMNSIFNVLVDFQNTINEENFKKENKLPNKEKNEPYYFVSQNECMENNHMYTKINNDNYNILDYLSNHLNFKYKNLPNNKYKENRNEKEKETEEDDDDNDYENENGSIFLSTKYKDYYEDKNFENSYKIEVINEPFNIKYHEHFLRDFYINVYVFLSLVIFFCVFFERLKIEIEYRKIFDHFHVHKYVHFFQLFLTEYLYYFIYVILLFMILYIFNYKNFLSFSYFCFFLLYGINIFLSIYLFSFLYLNSYVLFLLFNFIFCGIINIVIYVLIILSYAYYNHILLYISYIIVCIFRIFDSFTLSHSLNIRSLCLNMNRHYNFKSDEEKNKKNTLASLNASYKNMLGEELKESLDICSDSSIYFNAEGDIIFLLINCFVYLLIIIYKLLRVRRIKFHKENQKKKSEGNNSDEKYTFILKQFNLSDEEYKRKKMHISNILYFIKKFLSLKKKKQDEVYRKYNSSEIETNVSGELEEIEEEKEKGYISSDNTIRCSEKKKENFSKNNEKYILKNINIKIREYNIYTFSTIFNNDLNILYFFKYFFCKNNNGIYNYMNYNEEYNKNKRISKNFQNLNEHNYKIILIPYMSIYEHFKLILTFKKIKLSTKDLNYIINLFMLIVNLKCNIYIACNQLSGGMKKKVELMINLLKSDTFIFLYKLNDNIDFCSQIYINIILKNILTLNESYKKTQYAPHNNGYVSSYVGLEEEKGKRKINMNNHNTKKIKGGMKKQKTVNNSIVQSKGEQNFMNSNESESYLECSISSNLKSANQNIIDSFIKQNILKIKFNIKNFAIYTHIYTDMLYYDYLYLFHKNTIKYNNYIQNIKNNFNNIYLLQIKLKRIPEKKIREYMNMYFSVYKNTFKKYKKVLINFEKKSKAKKKHCYDRLQTNYISLFLNDNAKNNSLTKNNIYYLFKNQKKKKFCKKSNFLNLSKFQRTLFNLMIDKCSYLHSYLNKNKYISIYNLFKFVITEVIFKKIKNLIFKYKGIKNIYSEMQKLEHYIFILKIHDNKYFFKVLEINRKLMFNNIEIEVEQIDINNVSANDIFLLIFKKLL